MSKTEVKTSRFRKLVREEIAHAGTYTGMVAATRLLQFLLVPFFWRRLAPQDYGIVAIVDMLGGILAILSNLCLDQAITRFYYEWPVERRRKALGTLWIVAWCSNLALAIPSLAISGIICKHFFTDVEFSQFILVGVLGVLFGQFTAVPSMTLRIVRQPRQFAAFTFINSLIVTLSSAALVIVFGKGVMGIFEARLYAGIMSVLIGTGFMLRYATPSILWQPLQESLKYSLPTILPAGLNSMGSMVDRFLLQRFAGLEALGIYSVTQQFGSLISTLHSALKVSYAPFVFKNAAAGTLESKKDIGRMASLYILPYFLGGVFLSYFVGDFVRIVNVPKYFPVISYAPAFISIAVLSAVNAYFTPGILLSKRTDLLWIPTSAQIFVTVLFSFLLIAPFQVLGVAGTRLLAVCAYSGVLLALSGKLYPIPFEWSRLTRTLLLFVVFQIAGYYSATLLGMAGLLLRLFGFLAFALALLCTHSKIESIVKISRKILSIGRSAS